MLVKRRETRANKSRFIINPLSRTRHAYLIFMVIVTFVNLITIPVDMAFSNDLHGTSHTLWMSFNVISDVLFCVDIFINFRMGFFNEDDKVPVLDLKLIRHDYMTSWFIPDLLAAFPSDVFVIIVENYHVDTSSLLASKLLRILMFARILSMIRLLRVPKLIRFFLELDSVSNIQLSAVRNILRSACTILLLFLTMHWNACIQYFISLLGDFPSDSWVTQEDIINCSIGEKYSTSFFRAFYQMTWTPYGFSEPPIRIEEQWTAIISVVIGRSMLITLLALMIAAFVANKANQKKMENFERLPKVLRDRVAADHRWQQEKESICLLQESLKKDVMEAMCPNTLKGAMFSGSDVALIEAFLMRTECEIFQIDDIIVHQNAPACKMYFIEAGRVLEETLFYQQELSCGDFFGDIALLFGGRQPAKVCALTFCRLFSLSGDKLRELERILPHVIKDLREVAQEHLKKIEQCAAEDKEEDAQVTSINLV